MTEGNDDGSNLVRVRAQVMMRDDSTGGWVPMGGGGLSNVSVRKRMLQADLDDVKPEYFIYGKRISDQTVVLSCTIKKDFQYNKVMPTFHHWVTGDHKFGLTFQTAADARAFDKGVRLAVDDILEGLHDIPFRYGFHHRYADVGDDEVFMAVNLPVERDGGGGGGGSRSSSGSAVTTCSSSGSGSRQTPTTTPDHPPHLVINTPLTTPDLPPPPPPPPHHFHHHHLHHHHHHHHHLHHHVPGGGGVSTTTTNTSPASTLSSSNPAITSSTPPPPPHSNNNNNSSTSSHHLHHHLHRMTYLTRHNNNNNNNSSKSSTTTTAPLPPPPPPPPPPLLLPPPGGGDGGGGLVGEKGGGMDHDSKIQVLGDSSSSSSSSYVQFAKSRHPSSPPNHDYSYPVVVEGFSKRDRRRDSIASLKKQQQQLELVGGTTPSQQPMPPPPPPLLLTPGKRSRKREQQRRSRKLLAKARCRYCQDAFSEEMNERGSCEFAPDYVRSAIDQLTCISCARCMLYHCMSDAEGEFPHHHPCECGGPGAAAADESCGRRWLGLSLLSLLVPCLWCYLPLRTCHRCAVSAGLCGGKHEASS